MIKLKDFVDVNLTSVKPTSNERNKTVVYMCGANNLPINSSNYLNASNYEAVIAEQSEIFDGVTIAFINNFFKLGGASLRVIVVATSPAQSLNTVRDNNNLFIDAVEKLNMTEVAVVLREASPSQSEGYYDSTGYHYETFTAYSAEVDGTAVLLESVKSIVQEKGTAFRKLLVRGLYNNSNYTDSYLTSDEFVKDENLIWKLCLNDKDLAGVLAYLSKVSLDNPDSLNDYSFTEEAYCQDMMSYLNQVTWNTVKDFINVVVDLQGNGTKVNIGGNTSAGFDLVQEFESIYISQALVNKEMELLRNKINLVNASSAIHSAVISVMETYYKIGYLVQTTYKGNNIYRRVGSTNVCILGKGEVITAGYKVIILPKVGTDLRAFPEVELIINTNKGIRFIKTTGVVL